MALFSLWSLEKNNTPSIYCIMGKFGMVLIWRNGQKWPSKNFGKFFIWRLTLTAILNCKLVMYACEVECYVHGHRIFGKIWSPRAASILFAIELLYIYICSHEVRSHAYAHNYIVHAQVTNVGNFIITKLPN